MNLKMDKEILLLKYLDGELNGEEKDSLERLLEADPVMRELLDRVRSERELVLEQLRHLNPRQAHLAPGRFQAVKKNPEKHRRVKIAMRWAALLIMALGLVFVLRKSISPPATHTTLLDDPGNTTELLPEQEANAIDYAISPNRCWAKKQMIDIEIILKSN
jgi:anti-sigma factor RsiW